jgi:hypothetical protein
LSPVELRLTTDHRTLGAIARSVTTGDRVLAFAAMAAKRAFVQQRRGDDDDERASERACTASKRARARGLEWRQKKVHLTDNIAVWLGCGSPGILQTCFSLFLLMSPFTTLVAF